MDSCFGDIYHFDNTLEDFNPNVSQTKDANELISEKIEDLVKYISSHVLETDCLKDDCNIYSGKAGIAYMYWYLSRQEWCFDLQQRTQFVQNAKTLIIRSLQWLSRHPTQQFDSNLSVISGNTGIIFVSSLVFDSLSEEVLRNYYLNSFIRLIGYSIDTNISPNGSDSLFDGRAGYISASIIINKSINSQVISNQLLINLVISTINSGLKKKFKKYNSPLLYDFDSILYLGNSLGLSGILLALLSVPDLMSHKELELMLKESTEFVMSYMRSNGAFPLAANSPKHSKVSEEAISWCNGSAGIVWLLAKAYSLWKLDKYLKACIKIGDIVWKRGLNQHQPGLCHGISGNGYCFLLLYRLTSDPKHLYRAQQFAKFLISKQYSEANKECKNGFGLFEGYSGVVCFLADVLNAQLNKQFYFPLFFDI